MSVPMLLPRATDDPHLLRWSVGEGRVPEGCPQLAALVGEGVLDDVQIAPGEVRTRLAAGGSWRVVGPPGALGPAGRPHRSRRSR